MGEGTVDGRAVNRTLRDFCVRGHPPDEHFIGRSRWQWQDVPEQTFELDDSGNRGSYMIPTANALLTQIGRASCRERVYVLV